MRSCSLSYSLLLCEIDIAHVLHVDGRCVKVVDEIRQPLLQRLLQWKAFVIFGHRASLLQGLQEASPGDKQTLYQIFVSQTMLTNLPSLIACIAHPSMIETRSHLSIDLRCLVAGKIT